MTRARRPLNSAAHSLGQGAPSFARHALQWHARAFAFMKMVLLHVPRRGWAARASRRAREEWTKALLLNFSGLHCSHRKSYGTAGDSVIAAFGSKLAAVHCAVDIQNDLAPANDDMDKDHRMHFRIGINVGDVMVKRGIFSAVGLIL